MCVKQLRDVILYLTIFLINIKIKKYVVSEDPFLIAYCHNKYVTQKMCDEAVDDSQQH